MTLQKRQIASNAVEENVNVNTESGQHANTDKNEENMENRDGKLRKHMTRRRCKGKKSQLTSRKKKAVSSKQEKVESEAYRKLR